MKLFYDQEMTILTTSVKILTVFAEMLKVT